ncbi:MULTISPECIES: ABC transporter substrate-binding protein [Chromohalobacter]|uniref:Amino acid/amide ABC transporter substrate-binding protein, HAAT family n=1 Tax=Chromohalobacter israelensis (strain ATCC BAA-138 / DSM 3043 / CIP 106854 / NCIMB 13768 / 1H11) TaxID=290398 RepID=Q1QXN6_CHRI1|nr:MULTISPECIES: ABC transporter substrate-binding protein [Chromohalobacter]ABE58772.1 amino acid/amide ABC transporter substrate-binding protein, HAAT family [Chromohalobacter salexigens DSM 3043]MBZ5877088.1 ABC transporter substrate-binding protein [Chromohalobacter salexigens]MDO0944842.1 ABC transporter substrate-binding protein [Chromohalobacter salexigens]NQY44635.1 ABC transporter substrate-binding protein [Chromohalobacter sp.]
MTVKKPLIGAISAVALATSISALAEPLKIGVLVPLTGDLQSYGEPALKAAQLAAKEINAAGGVLGEDVEISSGDTQTSPQPGVAAAQKLVNIEGVNAIMGALSSGVTIPVAQSVAKAEQIPQVSSASTSPVITSLDDDDFLFRTVPSDAFQGVALSEVTQEKGYENVSIIYINNDYGKGLAEAFTQAFEKAGGTVSATVAYEQGQAAYRGELQQAASDDAEALVLVGYPENGQTILRQALEGGFFRNFVFTDGMKAPELVDNLGAQYLEGSVGTVPQARDDSPGAQHFSSAYESEYDSLPPKPYLDTAYDAFYLLSLAAQAAGSTDSVAIRDQLRAVANPPGEQVGPGEFEKAVKLLEEGKEIDYEGASGSVNFDDNGDVPGTFGEWTFKDGEVVTNRIFEPKM